MLSAREVDYRRTYHSNITGERLQDICCSAAEVMEDGKTLFFLPFGELPNMAGDFVNDVNNSKTYDIGNQILDYSKSESILMFFQAVKPNEWEEWSINNE
jgi:hypothetical protein